MEFSIVKSSLPKITRHIRGYNQEEITKFLNKQRPISVRIKGNISDESLDHIIAKLQSAV